MLSISQRLPSSQTAKLNILINEKELNPINFELAQTNNFNYEPYKSIEIGKCFDGFIKFVICFNIAIPNH